MSREEYVHLEGTTMVFRRALDHLVYEKTQGWIPTSQLKPGDRVSAHKFPPYYFKVSPEKP